MKRFCAVLCAFVLVIVLGLPVAAEMCIRDRRKAVWSSHCISKWGMV